MSSLPLDIITTILSHLSVKDLLRFKCVSKSWNSLINSPHFVKTHLTSQSTQHSNTNLVVHGCHDFYSLQHSTSFLQSLEIDYPYKAPRVTVEILGSCNGLLCIQANHIISIWNPSTKEYKRLPATRLSMKFPQSERGVCHGFGYDSTIDDYKVLKVVEYYDPMTQKRHGVEVKVYTLGRNIWRRIPYMDPFICWHTAPIFVSTVCVDGTLNWIATTGPDYNPDGFSIVSFDFSEERFRKVPHPKSVEQAKVLGVLGGKICLLDELEDVQIDVWMMKDYGVLESWMKLFTIPHLPEINELCLLRVLCFLKTGEIVFYDFSTLLLYDPKLKKIKKIHTSGSPDIFIAETYVESLVSPKSGTYVGKAQVRRERRQIAESGRKRYRQG